jgi:hypothetical protein
MWVDHSGNQIEVGDYITLGPGHLDQQRVTDLFEAPGDVAYKFRCRTDRNNEYYLCVGCWIFLNRKGYNDTYEEYLSKLVSVL